MTTDEFQLETEKLPPVLVPARLVGCVVQKMLEEILSGSRDVMSPTPSSGWGREYEGLRFACNHWDGMHEIRDAESGKLLYSARHRRTVKLDPDLDVMALGAIADVLRIKELDR